MNPDQPQSSPGDADKGLSPGKKLARLRQIVQDVAEAADLESALYLIVSGIRATMQVDACSVFLSDQAHHHYVLMAAEGLNPEVVGQLQLKLDEGLVGLVAQRRKPVNVRNAPAHPRYQSVPESGEEHYHGFLGVPVLHQGELLGVMVVQQVAERRFRESAVSFMVTLASQLAGAIALSLAHSPSPASVDTPDATLSRIDGGAGAPGIAMGTGLVICSPAELEQIPDRPADDPDSEIARLSRAVDQVAAEFERLAEHNEPALNAEDRSLFRAFALIARSTELFDAARARIVAGHWAPAALRDSILEHARLFEAMDDPYLRERAHDIRDIGKRLMARLLPEKQPAQPDYPERCILIGENLSPVDLTSIPAGQLVGVISGHGSSLSHLAILARALEVPAIMSLSSEMPLAALDGRTLIIDGYQGQIYPEPGEALRGEFRRVRQQERQLSEDLQQLLELPAETPDGVRIPLYTNAGLLSDLNHSLAKGAEGIGLYRTEFPFMVRNSFPNEEEQFTLYRQVLEAFHPRPVTLRTLDIGGDKALTYFPVQEENPYLGWRGIRISLDHPEIFLTQIRAMLRANAGLGNLNLLLPMISRVEDLDEALVLITRACHELQEQDDAIIMPRLGAMIEVPAAVYQADELARRISFLCVGSNDLTQYLLAVDRNNERVAKWFDALHPAVIRALIQVVAAGRRHGRPVSVCGEAAGDPAVALLLLGLGVESLSLSAGDLLRIKWVIRSFSRQRGEELVSQALALEQASAIRAMLIRNLVEAGLGALVHPGNSN
ncbi:phosphoenolpyruvate-protein phosphotransferase PtsP [Marinobacterium nitratireducens]|uniref:phosphoenolpyruvate--protein phosphotransferase n=1 Tax=Marinobacterium nitratireducens TaxID=518897 RepID=A0A917ZIJ7_9GAMM|nr:phosphoenolpyruvate--protein phosphotransferase [Marinobacterium nitratireducens]GGO83616.1 phosphoenolpyruvate-protein phosphotransferase PtsP [Marinobacterium nitratireducens]